mgnify:CR=1 FL=1
MRVHQYVGFIRDQKLFCGVPLQTLHETPAMYSADAGWGLGQVQSYRLLDILRPKAAALGLAAGVVSVGAIIGIFMKSLLTTRPGKDLPAPTVVGDTAALGKLLFSATAGYLLPFEIVSVHLLVVLVGAAYLARTKRRVAARS